MASSLRVDSLDAKLGNSPTRNPEAIKQKPLKRRLRSNFRITPPKLDSKEIGLSERRARDSTALFGLTLTGASERQSSKLR